MNSVWILTREFDHADGAEYVIVGVFSTEESANAAKDADPNPESWYGALAVAEWPVDS
ncbi:hypothetical protein [Actinospica sp.]|uniref:hypothetical protein n=1 Tax=Actinospica sp. TaxID=1872142 RepID=UPI002C79D783|nr:hypothetical protein [Actinospica sp.]HWG26108.1 hypothetical protein [Actinospica sp.]